MENHIRTDWTSDDSQSEDAREKEKEALNKLATQVEEQVSLFLVWNFHVSNQNKRYCVLNWKLLEQSQENLLTISIIFSQVILGDSELNLAGYKQNVHS